MSQSSTPHSNDRTVLFQQGGELSEFADLLSDLAMPVDEYIGGFPDPQQLEGARLVIVSGTRLLESGTPNLSLWPRTIAVIDNSSRTLVTQLSRIGVAMVIRRPIHPRALRLLLLHEIYRGPERRGQKRVLIGHPIRISSGLFRPHATLIELSPTGARLELANAPKIGTRFQILLGKDLTQSRPIKLRVKVIRSIRASSENNLAANEVGVAILDVKRHAKAIKGILDRFALGPAKWKTKGAAIEPESQRAASGSKVETALSGGARSLPPTHASSARSEVEPTISPPLSDETTADECTVPLTRTEAATTECTVPDELDAQLDDSGDTTSSNAPQKNSEDGADRRTDTRIPYDQRIVALGEEAARVLVGRDLCRGGMRVAPTPSIAVGDVLRVALHSGAQTEPLVVIADASRDDGDDGIILSFNDLSETQQEQLDEIIASELPVHASEDDLEAASPTGDAIVVAEMLETLGPQSDAEVDAHLDSIFDTSEFVEDTRQNRSETA